MPIPLGQYLQQAASQAQGQPGATAAPPITSAPAVSQAPRRPAPVEGPSGEEQARRFALKLAPKTLALAANPSPKGAADLGISTGLSLLGAYGGQEGRQAAAVAGALAPATLSPLVTTGLQVATGAVPATASAVGTSLSSGVAGGGGSLAFNAPQIVAGLAETFDPNPIQNPSSEAYQRRMKRGASAIGLQDAITAPLNGVETREDLARAFATRVGDATVGDNLASMVNANLSGTLYEDTGHGYLPDHELLELQRMLHSLGYVGTRVENGEIVRRESTHGDVGGVGEIISAAGVRLPAAQAAIQKNEEDAYRRWVGSGQETYTPPGGIMDADYDIGAVGWSGELRRLASIASGRPITSPAPFGSLRVNEGFYPDDGGPPEHIRAQDRTLAVAPGYWERLEAMDPDLAARTKKAFQARLDNYRVTDEAYHNAP